MREVGGRIVLMDFSGVRAADARRLRRELSGTPLYIAPEVFDGRAASFTADIYSLGILLFYLLSGHFPVEGADVAEIRRQHASGERIRLRDIRPELPDPVVQIVERATAVDPAAAGSTPPASSSTRSRASSPRMARRLPTALRARERRPETGAVEWGCRRSRWSSRLRAARRSGAWFRAARACRSACAYDRSGRRSIPDPGRGCRRTAAGRVRHHGRRA